MNRWLIAAVVAVGFGATPAWGHKSKRTDPCGCHHQWGLRHCHPTQKTGQCEAPASAERLPDKANPDEADPPERKELDGERADRKL